MVWMALAGIRAQFMQNGKTPFACVPCPRCAGTAKNTNKTPKHQTVIPPLHHPSGAGIRGHRLAPCGR